MRLIDADEFIEALEDLYRHAGWDRREIHFSLADTICNLDMMPTVEAEPVRHGKWIYSNDFYWYTASCNKCGYQRRTDIKAEGWNQWKFCPNCGAKMDERKEE